MFFKFYLKNEQANEIDFKKAFELIDYLDENETKVYYERFWLK